MNITKPVTIKAKRSLRHFNSLIEGLTEEEIEVNLDSFHGQSLHAWSTDVPNWSVSRVANLKILPICWGLADFALFEDWQIP